MSNIDTESYQKWLDNLKSLYDGVDLKTKEELIPFYLIDMEWESQQIENE